MSIRGFVFLNAASCLLTADLRPLILKWRAKACAYRKCRDLYLARSWDPNAKALAQQYKLLAELADSCAEDLDKAVGRIS